MPTSPQWSSPEEYGRRFRTINEQLARSFARAEFRGDDVGDVQVLQYHLAKLAIAAEDIQAAILTLANTAADDAAMAGAIVELRNACGEVMDSFTDANNRLIQLLNFLDR